MGISGKMRIIKLSNEYQMKPFDCGDADLNGFLMNDAKDYMEKDLANTFIVENDNQIIAYYSLLTAVPFYEKNGFKQLVSGDENKHTRLMYFDMMEL